MSETTKVDSRQDPLAMASETPDISMLITEFEAAQENGACSVANIAAAENDRYNRWPGKSSPPDGLRWQKNAKTGETVRPFDGRPDVDCQLVDEIILAEVDMMMTALAMAQMGASTTHTSKLTAAQMGELRAVAEWCRRVVKLDLLDDAELLAQMMSTLGWSVLNPGWCERWELVERELDMDSIKAMAAQSPPGSIAGNLPAIILDETLEDQAVEIFEGQYPHMDKAQGKALVRELRKDRKTTFKDRVLVEKRPTLRTLIQGYNYFISGSTGKIHKARGHLVMERFYEADLRQVAADNDWSEDFVEAVVKTAGTYSQYAESMRQKNMAAQQDASDRSIEIWTTYVNQFDADTGAAGIYCTTFSPHLRPGRGTSGGGGAAGEKLYAKHYLLAYAHGRAPFVQARREVIGPGMEDSRGVPDMVRSDAQVLKRLTDALVVRAHMEVNPPRALIGAGWTKQKGNPNEPGAVLENQFPGADIKELGPSRGNPQVGEMAIERIQAGTQRRFALPNTTDGSHPSSWQMRQMRNSKRWLDCFEEAYTQLVVLCYQELDVEELAEIIGQYPQLTVEDVLRHRITLTFDPRGLDNDWRKDTLDTMIQLLTIDKGGVMDSSLLVNIIGSYTDPTIMQAVTRDAAGASAALYRKVQNDINDIMLGNPAPMVEMDATAEMQLRMAFQIVGQNQKYQQLIANDGQVKENLKTYVKNLQHSVQETSLSPQQGRLGVATSPQRPVQQGPPH